MPLDRMIGAYCFCPVCLFVCLSVFNFNLRYNFWTVRDRDFIFGMHTALMTHLQMTPRSITLWPWLALKLKTCCRRGYTRCFTNTPWFFTREMRCKILDFHFNLFGIGHINPITLPNATDSLAFQSFTISGNLNRGYKRKVITLPPKKGNEYVNRNT